jgi:NADH-quinone oxidoreductase subunit G
LTSRPYAFNARPWELSKTETIDVMDALGANIRVDARGPEVLRVLPRLNEEINEEWITDKTRYACDGLKRQRLDRPFVRKDGRLVAVEWDEALAAAAAALSKPADRIGAIAGDLACAESMKATLDLFRALASPHVDCRPDGVGLGRGQRQSWLFNATLAGVEQADAMLLIGTDLRKEAPLLNARIRKAWLKGGLNIFGVGMAFDARFGVEWLGEDFAALAATAEGRNGALGALKTAQNPMLILGQGALRRRDAPGVLALAGRIAAASGMVKDGWNGFSVLHTAAARVGGLDMGFIPAPDGRTAPEMVAAMNAGAMDTLLLLGVDEVALPQPGKGVVIYIGSHGDRGASRADIVLPAAAFTEKAATYVNTEGRVQYTQPAAPRKGAAKEDWTILRALSGLLGKPLGYDDLAALRAKMIADHPTFGQVDYAPGALDAGQFRLHDLGAGASGETHPFVSPIQDFYLTNPIARASETMAACSKAAAAREGAAIAAE